MTTLRAVERPTVDPSQKAVAVAEREFDRWLRNEERSGVALRLLGTPAQLRERLLKRVGVTLRHERPGAAACQWVSESIGGWAPLEVLFPVCEHIGMPGVSGELPQHAASIVELAYGHVLAATGDFDAACDQLRADAQRLDLEIAAGRALCAVLDEDGSTDTFWVEELRAMQLAMSEYLHRQAIGQRQVLSDSMLRSYTARIGRVQRSLRERFAPSPDRVVWALAAAAS